MCKECEVKQYNSFDELPQELKDKFKSNKTSRFESVKKSYVDFINKLNINGDELIGDYTGNEKQVLIKFNKCGGHIPPKGINPYWYKKGVGCPVCKGFQIQQGVNDLATTHPHLVEEWHPTKNTKTPYNVTYGYSKKVWWLGSCGHEWEAVVHSRSQDIGCPYCANKKVLKGYNDIATTHPHFVQFFANKDDAYKYSCGSSKKVNVICPQCGKMKDVKIIISNLIRQGFSCSYCGDGISYSEKLMALVLNKLNVNFIRQFTYDNGRHRYDFYVELWDAIFETHGIQHYKGWCGDEEDLIRQQNNDEYKRNDAINHGILEENYNEVDCRYSTLEWCRFNIEKVLSKYVDITAITDEDWEVFDKEAQKNLTVIICNRWEEEKNINGSVRVTDLAEEFGIERGTVTKYLKWGNENGLCKYDVEEERQARYERTSKKVYLISPSGKKWFEEPMSQSRLAKFSGIDVHTISSHRRMSKPFKCGQNATYDSKYIGSYVVLAEEWDKLHENKEA